MVTNVGGSLRGGRGLMLHLFNLAYSLARAPLVRYPGLFLGVVPLCAALHICAALTVDPRPPVPWASGIKGKGGNRSEIKVKLDD